MKKEEFFQNGPELTNQFQSDPLLQSYLSQRLPGDVLRQIRPELNRLGERAVTDFLSASINAEATEPVHTEFDPWGRRIDEIETSPDWRYFERAAVEEGIVATGYERKYGFHSRLVQFAKLFLFHPSSAFVTCPLAMSDGAARAIELYGDGELKNGSFQKLISRNPDNFWTSGQWMTEKTGGSDVSDTQSVARRKEGDWFELTGVKFFASAITANMTMALGRIEGAAPGSRGLSLFYVPARDAHGRLQNIEVLRLKEKLGTRAMPTAEISLHGAPAKLMGGEGHGVKKISTLLNITRMYNSVCAVSSARRALALALDYSGRRRAFGRLIQDQPLHRESLSEMIVELEGSFLLTFHLAELLGRNELGLGSAEEGAMLRMLTPIAKLYTGKSCMRITSEALEVFGGAGYMEDSGIPVLLRNAQVFSIWEGTTNVLALDVLRAIEKEGAFPPFLEDTLKRLAGIKVPGLENEVAAVKTACGGLEAFLQRATNEGAETVQGSARQFAYSLARTCAASLLLEKASLDKSSRSTEVAKRWCRAGLLSLLTANQTHRDSTALIL